METKIRFIVRTPSNQIIFSRVDQIDQVIIAAKIVERFTEWEKKIKQEAAYHLLSNAIGAELAKGYLVSFYETKGSQPDTG